MNKSDKNPGNEHSPLLCEYAVMPFADCFCLNITGHSIPKVTRYCMEENSGCPVYAKQKAEKLNKRVKIDE